MNFLQFIWMFFRFPIQLQNREFSGLLVNMFRFIPSALFFDTITWINLEILNALKSPIISNRSIADLVMKEALSFYRVNALHFHLLVLHAFPKIWKIEFVSLNVRLLQYWWQDGPLSLGQHVWQNFRLAYFHSGSFSGFCLEKTRVAEDARKWAR